jgi:hypothetical protein
MLLFTAAKDIGNDCGVTIEYEWLPKNGSESSKLIIKATGGVSPYTFLLLDKKGLPKSMDFTKREFSGLESGEYRCIVLDKNECRTEISIVLK